VIKSDGITKRLGQVFDCENFRTLSLLHLFRVVLARI
jgi:hypothetical protein